MGASEVASIVPVTLRGGVVHEASRTRSPAAAPPPRGRGPGGRDGLARRGRSHVSFSDSSPGDLMGGPRFGGRSIYVIAAAFGGTVVVAGLLFFVRPARGPNHLLALLGSLMGAIFAASGLVVALVSVLTSLSLDRRIGSAYKRAMTELRAEFEKKADAQIEAHIHFLQATSAGDWQSTERLTREALRSYPGLKDARAYLGSRLADHVVLKLKVARAEWDRRGWTPNERWAWRAPTEDWPEGAPLAEAIRWLEDALEHGEDKNGEVLRNLALMWAAHGRAEKMLDYMRRLASGQVQPLLHPDFLMAIANGCKGDRAALTEAGGLLGITLPVAADTVRRWIEEIDRLPTPGVLTVWAMRGTGFWGVDAPEWPAQLAFGASRSKEGIATVRVSWFPGGGTVPLSLEYTDAETTAREACDKFAIVARCESPPVPPFVGEEFD